LKVRKSSFFYTVVLVKGARQIDQKEIEIRDIWRIIFQRLKFISVITIFAVLLTGIISFFVLTPEYEAVTTVIVNEQNSEDVLDYDKLIASEKLLKTYSEFVNSRSVAEEVIARLGLSVSPVHLLKQLKVQGSNDSLIASIVIIDEDPNVAVAISNAVVEVSLEKWNRVMNMDNVYILDEAKLPPNPVPVYPNPILNIVAAFFLSSIIGVILALLIEFLDRTLKTEEQVEVQLRLPVLGVIPLTDFEGISGSNPSGTEGSGENHGRPRR
jgi:capsular polysaccharide biosynthesis protein